MEKQKLSNDRFNKLEIPLFSVLFCPPSFRDPEPVLVLKVYFLSNTDHMRVLWMCGGWSESWIDRMPRKLQLAINARLPLSAHA
eukprot:565471-Amphidinium_carterae.1